MKAHASLFSRLLILALACVLLFIADWRTTNVSTALADNIPQTSSSGWQETPAMVSENKISGYCFDPKHTSILIVADQEVGTVAYDWQRGVRTPINSRPFQLCGPNGLLYSLADPESEKDGPTWRFSIDNPGGQLIAHWPTSLALDGTSRVYSFNQYYQPNLLTSVDGGLTWEDVGKPPGGRVLGYAMSGVDSRILYAVAYESATSGDTYQPPFSPMPETEMTYHNRVYFSSDGGQSWEKRGMVDTFDDEYFTGSLCYVSFMPGRISVVDVVEITVCRRGKHSNGGARDYRYFSTDGGWLFEATVYDPNYVRPRYYHTHEGILRLLGFGSEYRDFALSTDGGKRWDAMPLPEGLPTDPFFFTVVPQLPFMMFAQRNDQRGHTYKYYSIDGANSWHPLDHGFWGAYPPTAPFLPARSFMVEDGRLYMREWEGVGASLLARSDRNQVPGGAYAEETGHNLFGVFKQYWDAHGGAGQFGYPITEPFSEVSQVGGKAYTVQYFERAVMEMHPENADANQVQLGLLGTFAYQARYGAGGADQQIVSRDNPLYFPETGHSIGGKFRAYWESHGGVVQQGYPISDEFMETSVLDGKPYTVQYFQRAVFELHPENEGTPYAVLLGQLGSRQFKVRYGEPAR